MAVDVLGILLGIFMQEDEKGLILRMYINLEAEMKRKRLVQKDIANLFSGRRATVSTKIRKCSFSVREAITIKNAYFPNFSVEFLFAEDEVFKEAE